ncbi:hypothetical protein MKX01_010751 [Papaver californicum]|nr:hypothetical protein MKX01_010751 [Papaver californicum]
METPSPPPALVPGEHQVLLENRTQKIEAGHGNLEQQLSNLAFFDEVYSRPKLSDPNGIVGTDGRWKKRLGSVRYSIPQYCHDKPISSISSGMNSNDKQYLNILQSMGQAVHVFDVTGSVKYWNRSAENLYGYSASEALGRNVFDLLVETKESREDAMHILRKNATGVNWTGTFPVKNKQGERILILITNTPLYDDNCNIAGVICVSTDSQNFLQILPVSFAEVNSGFSQLTHCHTFESDLDSQQPLQVVVTPGGSCTLRGDVSPSPFGVPFKAVPVEKFLGKKIGGEGEGKTGIHQIHTPTAEACTSKKNMPCPWKGSEHNGLVARTTHDIFAWMRSKQEDDDFDRPKSSDSYGKSDVQVLGSNQFGNEANDFYSSSDKSGVTSVSSNGSTSNNPLSDFDTGTDLSDYDILWEELTVGEQIGRGSCGTVYHGMWCGSVSLMKKLRHPNVLLFMGAVTSPEHLCIVTEVLPRGSLFQLLQRGICKIDWRRRVLMALDIARGMSYLHSCSPAVVHCDLKSSNLLVDKNWTVKVGDFGLSRLKHATYLSGKSGKGTPQWMAPEVMRNDPLDEKSDVFSFGVILWELCTQMIPWGTLNSFQVIGAVGFMDQRLDIPKDTGPDWASLIESCWHSEPKCRPTFERLLGQLKVLQKKLFCSKAESKYQLGRLAKR